jgi:4-carboxymuconolactone decarboxylase
MARLPDPVDALDGPDREAAARMAAARAGADGRAALAEVYVSMFNNPAVARAVGALGEQIRFAGVLPDDARELAILRAAARQGFRYEWSHHVRPARLAGIPDEIIAALAGEAVPDGLAPERRAVVEAVDAVVAQRSIPADVQERVVAAFGLPGVVELVVLCGLYALMGYVVTAFDVEVEEGFPPAPF